MNAEILCVGTEILLGDIVNTNAQYLGQRLAEMGINVYYQTSVGDNKDRLKKALEIGFSRSDLVITTGGLGPTDDDLTKETICEYFNLKLVVHEPSLENIKNYYKIRHGHTDITEGNKKQSYVPEGSVVLQNRWGSAPGCVIEKEGKALIMLPGPPSEMTPMFNEEAFKYLSKYQDGILYSNVLRLTGIGESMVEEEIRDMIRSQSNPTIAPYAKTGETILRITAKAKDEDEAINIIKPVKEEIYNRLSQYIYGEGDTTLEEEIAKLIKCNGYTIATAESCTGGMLASRLVNYPGISDVFLEGMVTYSNEAKIKRLGVKDETLEKYGAVSEEVAFEMANGISSTANTNIGISVTGIAGPGGGSEEKPVGLVYIGICINGKTNVKKLNLSGSRNSIRNITTLYTLNFLRYELINTI
jgi:nicotinamide-nucleotide amidase